MISRTTDSIKDLAAYLKEKERKAKAEARKRAALAVCEAAHARIKGKR